MFSFLTFVCRLSVQFHEAFFLISFLLLKRETGFPVFAISFLY